MLHDANGTVVNIGLHVPWQRQLTRLIPMPWPCCARSSS
jgi:hypothetical protein